MEKSNEVKYREIVYAGRFVKYLIASVIFFMVALLPVIVIMEPETFLFTLIVSGGVFVFLGFLYVNYRKIEISITDQIVYVRYGFFNKKKIPLNTIISCEPTKTNFKRYGGIGVRLGLDRSWAYTTSFGEGVKIKRKEGLDFVFSTNNPDKICGIISSLVEAHK